MSDIEPIVTPVARGRGRPTKYDPAFCDEIVAMGQQGFSYAEMANGFDVIRDTLTAWAAEHPDFSAAVQRAKSASLAWWENEARNGINKGSAFNAALWAKSMSGRFPAEPYRDRAELSGPNGGPIATASVDLTTATSEQLAALAGLKLGGE